MDMLLFFRTIWRTSCRTLRRRSAASLIALLLVGWSSAANAFWALGMVPGVYIPQSYYKHGAVYTRAIVLSQAGNPYYVEYDSSGNEGREIAEKTGQYERAQIVAGTYYRSQLQRLADSKERYPEHEELTAAAYRSSSFTTAAGETIQKPSISPAALTVLVRAQNNRYLKDGSDLLLLELPIKASVQPSASSQSILLSEAGDILHQTANTIAFRVGFFGKDGKVETSKRRDFDSQIYGKMPNVVVSMGGFTPGGIAATDENGKYSMNYFLPPCPGFTFEYTTPVYLELYYSRFNPRGNSMMPYYLVRQDYDFCNGLSALSMWATLAMTTSATFIKPKFDFPVDLMVVDGAASFANVKLDAKTAYNPDTSDYAKTLQNAYDFDGDEKPEIIVPGKKVKKEIDGKEREVFVETAVAEAELQGIYLSSRHNAKPASTEDTAPDFTRLIDTTADFKDRGMLQSITSEDLRDTDIYVFRESTGQLVAERRGLHENELYKNYSGVDDKQGSFRFTIQLRGSAENTYALSGRNGEANFNKWQSAGGFTEEFQKRTANHLKSGEQVRIIAINRPTGYMGSTRINLNASLNGNLIDLNQARIQLTPPNLKIWAERKNKIEQGMTRGEEKKQLIGNEGAGLGSDISIAIYSDWRDQDGGPLPEALADYGYTGRLAKIVAANQLAPVGANNLSQFKIKPGQQVQVIQLPEKVLAKQHLYLQVAGQPENRNPDFATGNGQGILKYRPSKYVPVQVPLHDEQASEIARQAYRKADKEKPELNLKKPEPMYSWQYRPEMQFSLYELNVADIRRRDSGENTSASIDMNSPALSSSVQLIEFLYTLLQSDFGQLAPVDLNGEREVVLALGADEVKVRVGADQSISFGNLEHLASLQAEDFLSLRLYSNNDVANILWEWAFDQMLVIPAATAGGEIIKISADDAFAGTELVEGLILTKREGTSEPAAVDWSVSGNATLGRYTETNTSGYFQTFLKLPTTVGATATVKAKFRKPSMLEVNSATYEVIPGKPHRISYQATGKTTISELGGVELDIRVFDRFNNKVADGTLIDIQAEDMVLSGSQETLDGKIRVTLKGKDVPGDKQVSISAGGVAENTTVRVHDVQLSVELADSLSVGGSTSVTVTAESDFGDLTGLPVQLSSLRGVLDKSDLVIEGDRASTILHAGDFAGDGKIVARLNNQLTSQPFNVRLPDGAIRVSNPLLVSSRIGELDPSVLGASAQTQIQVAGNAGETVNLDLLNYLKPNLLPLASWGLYGMDAGGNFLDEEAGAVLESIGVQINGSGVTRQAKYADLTIGDQLRLAHDNRYEKSGDIGFTLAFNSATIKSATLAELPGSSLQVILTDDGRIKASVQLEDDSQVEVSASSVAAGQWHRLGVHVINGEIILQLDQQISRASLNAPLKIQTSAHSLIIGGDYRGHVNELALFDWSQSPVLRLANGEQQSTVQVAADGYATFTVVSHFSNLMSQRVSPNKSLLTSISSILVAHAFAADGDDPSCTPVSTDDLIGSAEAFLKFIVDCKLQQKIRQAELRIETASGFKETTLAYIEYGTYKALRTQINNAGQSMIYLAQCMDGVVTGSADSGVGMLCDFVASLLLVGDVRDFAIHGYYLFTGNMESFDQATYVFASLGIISTFAELTGVGVTLDAAIAGGKTAAKVMKGSKILSNMVGYLDRQVIHGASGKRLEAMNKVLPLLQVVALAAYEGGNIKDFLVAAVDSVDDFDDWVKYSYRLIEGKLANLDEGVTSTAETRLNYFVGLWVGAAHAAGIDLVSKSVREFAEILEKVQEIAIKGKVKQGDIAKFYTKVISQLNKAAEEAVDKSYPLSKYLSDIEHKEVPIAGLIKIAERLGADGLLVLRKSPCVPSTCRAMGASIEEFMGRFHTMGKYFPENADELQGFDKLIEQLSAFSKTDPLKPNMRLARSSAATVDLAARKAEELTAAGKKVEITGFEVDHGLGDRAYDVVMKVDDVDIFVETKSWELFDEAKGYLSKQVTTARESSRKLEGVTEPGQIVDDIINAIREPGSKVRWAFSDPAMHARRMEFVEHVMEEIGKNKVAQEIIMRRAIPGEKYIDNLGKVEKALRDILEGI
jgi:hypothetical protein